MGRNFGKKKRKGVNKMHGKDIELLTLSAVKNALLILPSIFINTLQLGAKH